MSLNNQRGKSDGNVHWNKVIKAEPAKSWKQFGDCPQGEEGYKVEYEDGYLSWSPKAVFEAAYVKIEDSSDIDIMKFFAFEHLPPYLQKISMPFAQLANQMISILPHCPERSAGLRKLLEAKGCAVRANI